MYVLPRIGLDPNLPCHRTSIARSAIKYGVVVLRRLAIVNGMGF